MTVDIELVVLDPGGMIDVERRFLQPRFEDRRDVQPRGDHRLEILKEGALVILRQSEDRHAPDMHRHFRRFQVQKRRVHRGQLLGVTHIYLPKRSRGALMALLAFRPSLLRDGIHDCAFSGGAYAMANGPDRSNCLNSPSACAKRSATAHKAAGLTPSPTWLARCTSIFSAVAEGRSRQVRQFTMPSVREWIDVVGTGRAPAIAVRSSELSTTLSPPTAPSPP